MSERKGKPAADADPFQVWREWVDRAERQLNASLAELMETERFGRSTSRVLELMMECQAAKGSATQRYLSTLNLPTRADVVELGERLSSIEERLVLLERAVSS
ncbi:MAG TPA: hypothetical protein VMT85_24990, partial [Thermoanaerobaculia bacterium]|nr:hypothetical protein [Thermoanaerobaculia bacterium]